MRDAPGGVRTPSVFAPSGRCAWQGATLRPSVGAATCPHNLLPDSAKNHPSRRSRKYLARHDAATPFRFRLSVRPLPYSLTVIETASPNQPLDLSIACRREAPGAALVIAKAPAGGIVTPPVSPVLAASVLSAGDMASRRNARRTRKSTTGEGKPLPLRWASGVAFRSLQIPACALSFLAPLSSEPHIR